MKICILVSNSLKKDPRVIKQIKTAKDIGYDVFFIGFKDAFYDKKFLDSVGCDILIVKTYVGKLNSVFKQLIRKFHHFFYPIKYIIQINPNIIHANDIDTLIQAYIASKFTQSKVIYDSHEICAENIGVANKFFQKKIMIFLEKIIVRRISAMISVSNSSADYFSKLYKIKKPIVITNVPYKFKLNHVNQRSTNNFEVLYQGLMIEGRGYEEFVESGKYVFEDIKLVIRGYGFIEEKLNNLIIKNNLQNIVEFAKPVEIKDIIQTSSKSHLGVVLTQPVNINFQLTISNKIFEYIHAGLPVLMSDIPEHRYLNEKFKFGIIINNFSAENIAKEINDLSKDTFRYNELRTNAINAAEILNWENESKKLIQAYKKITQNNILI